MRVGTKIFLGIGAVLVIAIGFFVIFPYLLVGPPLPLLSIENKDINNEHEVVVEIFNSNNQSIFKKTVLLSPNEEISYPKPLWLKLPWTRGEYTFKITMDDTYRLPFMTEIYPWVEIHIILYSKDRKGQISPLTIVHVMV